MHADPSSRGSRVLPGSPPYRTRHGNAMLRVRCAVMQATGEGDRVSEQASPRGTFLQVAEEIKAAIGTDPNMTHLPSAADLMRDHGVSRGVALRAFKVLQKEGLAEPVRGGRWRVVRAGEATDHRPLHERIAEIILVEGLAAGAQFPSASELASRFGVSRPTVSKALDRLEAVGVLTGGGQGKVRTVRAVPAREERS
ncbi:GntR family transcriptional regulator [Streptomyces sp. NPDC051129]|uniref:GntR family transcriptional regulator n=2 Tax=unclassified Streptomyces TaxID=2593676 RepID=UPI00342A0831